MNVKLEMKANRTGHILLEQTDMDTGIVLRSILEPSEALQLARGILTVVFTAAMASPDGLEALKDEGIEIEPMMAGVSHGQPS